MGERESRGRCEGPPILAGRVQGPPSSRRGLSAKRDKRAQRAAVQTRRWSGAAAQAANNSPRWGALIRCCPWPNPCGRPGVHEQKHTIARRTMLETQQCNARSEHRGGATASHADAAVALCAQSPQKTMSTASSPPYVSRCRSVSARAFQARHETATGWHEQGFIISTAQPLHESGQTALLRRRRALDCRSAGMAQWTQHTSLCTRLTGDGVYRPSTSCNARRLLRRGRRRALVVTPPSRRRRSDSRERT
jgi:hypothetical protein